MPYDRRFIVYRRLTALMGAYHMRDTESDNAVIVRALLGLRLICFFVVYKGEHLLYRRRIVNALNVLTNHFNKSRNQHGARLGIGTESERTLN
jgi:hypothetical protein